MLINLILSFHLLGYDVMKTFVRPMQSRMRIIIVVRFVHLNKFVAFYLLVLLKKVKLIRFIQPKHYKNIIFTFAN